MGIGDLGAYGQKKIRTPNIDKLATEGMKFTQHYTSAPVCAPARCMLMTGRNAGHSYIRGNHELGGFADSLEAGQQPLPEGIFTLPKMLKNAGYNTGLIGKWGLGFVNNSGSPLKQGFDYYYSVLDQKQAHNYYPTHVWENDQRIALNNQPINVHKRQGDTSRFDIDYDYFKGKDYVPAMLTKQALAFLDKYKSKPFFLYLPYTIPHASLQAPDEYVEKYIGLFDEKPYYGQRGYAAVKYPRATYAAMLSFMDEQVGIIMKKLKQLELDKNTIVMFSSDNGPSPEGGAEPAFFNSSAGLRGQKRDLYEGGIRTPFIARWPGKIPAGKTSSLVSTQYDLMATLAELTKQKVPETEGISFLPELLGKSKKQKQHEYLYFEFGETGGSVAVRMGEWKGVKTGMRKNKNVVWQIFNLKSDSAEKTDVAAQHPKLIQQFDEIVAKEHQAPIFPEWEFIKPNANIKPKCEMSCITAVTLKGFNFQSSIADVASAMRALHADTLTYAPWKQFPYHPEVKFTIANGGDCIFLQYQVKEKYFRAVNTEANSPVWEDGAVEFFIAQDDSGDYYNFEFNAIGTPLCGFGKNNLQRQHLPAAEVEKIKRLSVVADTTIGKVNWELTLAIPASLFKNQMELTNKIYRCNFFKCGDLQPEPHFVTWTRIENPQPNFHLPAFFGEVRFE